MRQPYIGMTDVPNADWLRTIMYEYVTEGGQELRRDLHAGVMMSYKTLNGLETKWSAAWPKNEEIAGIFIRHCDVLNTLHYADYDGASDAGMLTRAASYGGEHLNAVQLDMIWPLPEILRPLNDDPRGLRLILQVGPKALAQVDDDAGTLVDRLKPYGSQIHDVLLDASGGKGRGLDPVPLEAFIYELRARRPDLGIAVAGGLGPDTLHLIEPLVRKFPELSIDAQGQLRPSGNSLDPIDYERAAEYLRKAIALFRSC